MKRSRIAFAVLLLAGLASALSVQAQSGVLDLYSPVFLARGVNTASLDSPQADVINPAAAGGRQNLTLDVSYVSLMGLGDESGFGHVVNAGVSIPSRIGVFTTSGHFLSSPFENVYGTTYGALSFSFAKDIFRTFWIGAGLGFQYGSDDWGLGLDVGIMHLTGDIVFLKDFRWGVALRGIGKGYFPDEGEPALPPAFTPSVGASFKLVKTDPFSLAILPDISFPMLQDIQINLGVEFSIYDFLFLDAAYVFDLRDTQEGQARPLPLSFGAAIKIKPGRKITDTNPEASEIERMQNGIRVSTAASPRQDGVWAMGAGVTIPIGIVDKNPPVVTIDTQRRYISPNFDGVQDALVTPLSITDERYVSGFRFLIQDAGGNTVRVIRNKEVRPENKGIREVLDRLIAVKESIIVPEDLRWDGRSDSGSVVPDGPYRFFVEAWDDNENMGKSEAGDVVVDNTPPSISLQTPYLVFSPNADDNQDTLMLQQSGTKEDLWTALFLNNASEEIMEIRWEGATPPPFEWDGTDRNGILPPDGVYRYLVTSTDRAGNTATAVLDNIIINTEATPVSVTLEPSAFSPNNDGAKDTVTFTLTVPVKRGIREWSLTVKDQKERVRRSFAGKSTIPSMAVFDGRDDSEELLPEGIYRGTLTVLYEHGNRPVEDSPVFTLDITPPKATVTAGYTVFSPNGDGKKDSIVLWHASTEEELWQGSITDGSGRVVRSQSWRMKPDDRVEWDGRGDDGKPVPNGRYTYTLRGEDRAGNVFSLAPVSFRIDTRETEVKLSTDLTYFSPNADNIKDTVWILSTLSVSDGVERYELRIVDGNGKTVKTFGAEGRAPGAERWDGLTDQGAAAPDGAYTAELEILYLKGDNPSSRSNTFYLDTVFPTIRLSADYAMFSPDNDGSQDTIPIRQSSSEEDLWLGQVLDNAGKIVRGIHWKGRTSDFLWDGRDVNGNRIPDGAYAYVISAQDKAGNQTIAKLESIRIDTKPTPIGISVSTNAFSPNADGIKDTVNFLLDIPIGPGIKEWKLSITDGNERVRKTFSGSDTVPPKVIFDGRDDSGRLLGEGSYKGSLSVLYLNGNNPKGASPPFILDISPPTALVTTDTPFFSPNGDGSLDVVILEQETTEEPLWEGTFRDRNERVVKTAKWVGRAERQFQWDGRGEDGKLLPDGTYTYVLTATDSAGNSGRSRTASVRADTRETTVQLVSSLTHFSPNSDGVKDTIRFVPTVGLKEGIDDFELRVKNAQDMVVKTFRGSGRSPDTVIWDGSDNEGRRATDGQYTAELIVRYRHGNRPVSQTSAFLLDTVLPTITLSINVNLFSPNEDGRLDTVRIQQGSSYEDLWEAKILDSRNRTVRSFYWKGRAETFDWDGRDENGNPVPDGAYRYTVKAEDKAGNATERSLDRLTVDTRRTWAYITVTERAFSPNGDGIRDTIDFRTYVGLKEGIKSWKISMVHSELGSRRTFAGTDAIPEELRWDGRGTDGSTRSGLYTAVLEVDYFKGDRPEGKTIPFRLDNEPPAVELQLNPVPFSPDRDGVDDELNITIKVNDISPITKWNIDILDPMGRHFTSYSGRGEPADRIMWDGLSDRGELVQSAEDYTLILTMEDELGNTITEKRTVSVDILVMREGDRLKIIISSIVFAPYSADYMKNIEPEKVEKNNRTLQRLAEILQKYRAYKILIEGHAVAEHFADPARAQKEQIEELIPLSKARAGAVRDGLVERGVSRGRITTVGLGGSRPLVPHSDLENRWKNRRVEFLLIK